MIVTAWNNGSHHVSGAGYGLKISSQDRDRYLKNTWQSIFLRIEDQSHELEIDINKESFWGSTYREFIHKDIGLWLRTNNMAPWPKNTPPKLNLVQLSENHFVLCKICEGG
jgi:hypothetical protein